MLNRSSLDVRLGNRTLSSLAFPIFEWGSSCSLSMLNRADRLGINKLVRKSSDEGRTVVRSNCGLGSGWFFLFLRNVLDENLGRAGMSESVEVEGRRDGSVFASWKDFFLDRKRFILSYPLPPGAMDNREDEPFPLS